MARGDRLCLSTTLAETTATGKSADATTGAEDAKVQKTVHDGTVNDR